MNIEKAAEILSAALPDLEVRVLYQVVDMPIDQDYIEISKRGLLSRRVIARVCLYQGEEEKLFELEFEDPIDEIIDTFVDLY